MSPHSRMDPARADHIPVMEYKSGVTVLLFSATKTRVKSWVTSACSIAPAASSAPTSMTGARSRPSPPTRPIFGAALEEAAASRRGRSPATMTTAPAMLARKASHTPIVPRWASTISPGPSAEDHQQTAPVALATRPGYWAL